MQILSYSKRFSEKVIFIVLLGLLSGCCSFSSKLHFVTVNKIHNYSWVEKIDEVDIYHPDQYFISISGTNTCGVEEIHTYQISSNQYYKIIE
jgi:hypothetical protein